VPGTAIQLNGAAELTVLGSVFGLRSVWGPDAELAEIIVGDQVRSPGSAPPSSSAQQPSYSIMAW
jgi:hypothetical protein